MSVKINDLPDTADVQDSFNIPASTKDETVKVSYGLLKNQIKKDLEIDKVFQSVSNGKKLLAESITDCGVRTSASDTFQKMSDNIYSIVDKINQEVDTGKALVADAITYKGIPTESNSSFEVLADNVLKITTPKHGEKINVADIKMVFYESEVIVND